MCEVQKDMGKHLVPLIPSDEGHKIEHKQKSDSVTRTWVIVMKPDAWLREDMGKHLVPLTSSDEGHKIEHKQKSDSVTRTWVIVMKPDVWRTGGQG